MARPLGSAPAHQPSHAEPYSLAEPRIMELASKVERSVEHGTYLALASPLQPFTGTSGASRRATRSHGNTHDGVDITRRASG